MNNRSIDESERERFPASLIGLAAILCLTVQIASSLIMYAISEFGDNSVMKPVILSWLLLGLAALLICIAAALKRPDQRWIGAPLLSLAILDLPILWVILF